jgi:hypothetical protein
MAAIVRSKRPTPMMAIVVDFFILGSVVVVVNQKKMEAVGLHHRYTWVQPRRPHQLIVSRSLVGCVCVCVSTTTSNVKIIQKGRNLRRFFCNLFPRVYNTKSRTGFSSLKIFGSLQNLASTTSTFSSLSETINWRLTWPLTRARTRNEEIVPALLKAFMRWWRQLFTGKHLLVPVVPWPEMQCYLPLFFIFLLIILMFFFSEWLNV